MADKIVNQLPVVLQTTAIKNFFESTVEQLYSRANTVPLKGFIGKQTGEDVGLIGSFIKESTADRREYNLTPAVNNINPITGESENLIFYDEFINTLRIYGVTTRNHNVLFGSHYNVFMPPIDIDKFINHQEYYWVPAGPTTINITATAAAPIDIDRDIIGKSSYTYGNTVLRNGMIISFADNGYTIPAGSASTASHNAGVEYIVGGVGNSIFLVRKDLTTATLYGGSSADEKDYIVIERGAPNNNAWSRVNHWYHRNNFLDAGDNLPDREYRANRPIIEFDRLLEMYNHGTSYKSTVTLASEEYTISTVQGQSSFVIDTYALQNNDTIIFVNESESNKKYVYTVGGVGSSITLTAGAQLAENDVVVISSGYSNSGAEFAFDGTDFYKTQRKDSTNQQPLFVLYDDSKNRLDDAGLYPRSSFTGNKIFGYKVGTGAADSELGFAVHYTPFKSISEITFENFIQTGTVTYQAYGSSTVDTVTGSYYYKRHTTDPEFYSYWKPSNERNQQRIITTHYVDRFDVDRQDTVYDIGAVPDVTTSMPSGYDIIVKVNGVVRTDYTYYQTTKIKFNTFNLSAGDVIDISVASESGIVLQNDSRYEIPLSWRANPHNEEIELIAEPHYLKHFKHYVENQQGFSGEPLASNNFSSTSKDIKHAKDIVQTDQDLILAAFLLDDQPHNLVDALRFNAREYEKYKSRLLKEITEYYNTFDLATVSTEYALDRVLRNLISYSVGKNVFSSTYIIPFGDNYIQENFDVANTSLKTYTLANYLDISNIENSLLVYLLTTDNELTLLTLDTDYTVSSTGTIELILSSSLTLTLGDTIITKLYDKNRDNAQCPPTPSTMGLYPLHVPVIETDNSFSTPIRLLVGHDGSRTQLFGDRRDSILLEFEKRVYNTAKNEFRATNSLPTLNVFNVRSGAFRDNNLSSSEYTDLLRNSFTNWAGYNKVDYIVNEFYNVSDNWTWNYRGSQNVPGYWKGWYEYYYDTVRPHTHPWEMLAFFEKPSWWDTQYSTNYSSTNTSMWSDLEQGIIRQGPRENLTNNRYLYDNPFRRVGLSNVLPVNESAELLPPAEITDTGTTTISDVWYNQRLANTVVTNQFVDYVNSSSNNLPDNINITYDSSNVYITNSTLDETYQVNNSSFSDFTSGTLTANPTATGNKYIGVTVTGVPIVNPTSLSTWNDEGTYQYNEVYLSTEHETGTYVILPEHAGLTEWDTANHSPIVGWAFDGLPIYGPYGYKDPSNSSSDIVPIKSCFILSAPDRSSGPNGKTTGEFVNDYDYDSTYAGNVSLDVGFTGSPSHADIARYNMRYGVTPESPSTPIYYYVATLDDNGNPMFPYVIGGTETVSTIPYKTTYYTTPLNPTENNTGSVSAIGANTAISSSVSYSTTYNEDYINSAWRFGDGAPVENAWKYSVGYPYAVAEAVLLARPGRFATVFADPTNVLTPSTEQYKLISSVTRKPWDYRSSSDFRIHGDINASTGESIINVGYTQFIHSWLAYQSLNTKTDFSDKLRKVNIKLSHRVAGFTDKDTLIVRTDQVSQTGTSTSLIIPEENISVVVHSSPYKTRNFYSGVMVQKTENGYKVRGYDKNFGYFNILRLNRRGKTSKVEVGGTAADYTIWEPNVSYSKDIIVSYQNGFYRAMAYVPGSETFVSTLWQRLPSLPQLGAVRATLYLDSLPQVDRVDYETEYTTYQEVVDLLVALGMYQESLGYYFGDFDNDINDVRNWNYTVRQFLFWVSGGWENNNIVELSPLAVKLTFNSPEGMVAKINRIEKNQYSLIDQNGRAIQPTECEIVRDGTSIQIVPPEGLQIYGAMLFTKQIEHALVLDNLTVFNDTIFNTLYNQKQERLRVKGIKTANWNGTLSSQGFIIDGDELKPNLDNMAQSLGRYHELGFIPVEKQIYETARSLFGYQERTYLNELDIDDDDQFEFYTGMLQEKGTTPSLSKIAKSKFIIQGEMEVYDEWAVRVGDFGDLENDQSIELKLEKSDITQDPQLVTLAFPEDTTGVVKEIRVISAEHSYHAVPTIEISAPSKTPAVQATATPVIDTAGVLTSFVITNPGSGYDILPVRLQVLAGNLVVSNINTTFNTPIAYSSDFILEDVTGLGLTTIELTDNFGNSNVSIDLSSANTVVDVIDLINLNANVNANIVASSIESYTIIGSNVVSHYSIQISGPDFYLDGNSATLANLNLTAGRYEPVQKYSIFNVDNHPTKGTGATTVDDVRVYIDGANIESSNGNVTNWTYDSGSRTSYSYAPDYGNPTSTSSGTSSGNVSFSLTTNLDSNNIVNYSGTYPYLDVYVDGFKLINLPSDIKYTVTTSTITLYNVEDLPGSYLATDSNIYVYEHPTVTFDSSFTSDLPGETLNIKTLTKDHIAILTESKRLYDIMEDDKGDEVILIDIDDSSRFLKKPIGVRENALWPTTSNVDYSGVGNESFVKIPNAGYVSKSNVDYLSFNVPSIADMFDDTRTIHPSKNDIIHVAVSENIDWNVYSLKEANVNGISFIEAEPNTVTSYLYTQQSLFDHVDSNRIGNIDLGRYLDYHVVVKQGQTNEKFMVWVNEEVVDRKQVRLSNIYGVKMTEVAVSSIGPDPDSILSISNITPGLSDFVTLTATPTDVGTVTLSGRVTQLTDGDVVSFATSLGNSVVSLHGNTYTVSNVDLTNGTFTVSDYNLLSSIGPLTLTGSNISIDATDSVATITLSSTELTYLHNGDTVDITDTGVNIGPYTATAITETDADGIVTITSLSSANLLIAGDTVTITNSGGNSLINGSFTVFSVGSDYFEIELANVDSNAIAAAGTITVQSVISQSELTGNATVNNINVTTSSFTIEVPGLNDKTLLRASNIALTANNLYYSGIVTSFYGKTTIESVDHGLSSGQIVKLDAGRYSGIYAVEQASANTFVINTPWSSTATTYGNVLLDKIQIVTQEDHGLGNAYVGSRVVVHKANPKYYNQVYTVHSVTANTIVASNKFPYDANTTAMGNCILSTLDHDVIKLNSSKIKLDNIKSVDGIIESINRNIKIRKGFVTKTGSFSMHIPMTNTNYSLDGSMTSQIAGSIPYITDPLQLSDDNITITGSITVDPAITTKSGFNTDPINASANLVPRTSTSLTTQGWNSTLNANPFAPVTITGPAGVVGTRDAFGGMPYYSPITGTYFPSPIASLDDYTEGLVADYVITDMVGQTRMIDMPTVLVSSPTTTSSPTINNPTPIPPVRQQTNNTGSIVIVPTAVTAIPTKNVCGDIISTPPTQPTVPAAPAVAPITEKCEKFQQASNVQGATDSWRYLIDGSGPAKIIFDMYGAADKIVINQITPSGTVQVASTSTARIATIDEKLKLDPNFAGKWNDDIYNSFGFGSSSATMKNFTATTGGFVTNCGVIEFNWDATQGIQAEVVISKAGDSSIYRGVICYPTTTSAPSNPQQNTNPGQPANAASVVVDTPIIQPATVPTTKKLTMSSYNAYGSPSMPIDVTFYNRGISSGGYYNNYGGFSQAPMAGFSFIPSVFKKIVKTALKLDQSKYTGLSSTGPYVNSSSQRTVGGVVIPLALPISAPVLIQPKSLRTIDLLNDPLYKTLGDIGNSKDLSLNYQPKKIASNNYLIDSMSLPTQTGSTITYSPLVGEIPTSVPGSPFADPQIVNINLMPDLQIAAEDAPVDVDNFTFTDTPVITILPKVKNSNGDYVAAGPIAYCPITRPTPSITIGLDDLIGTKPGDEVLINNQPLVIQKDPFTTLERLKCIDGAGFTLSTTVKNGKDAVKLSSCTNAPITVRDGCAGGVYKEVLDFHLVKEFSSSNTLNGIIIDGRGRDGYTYQRFNAAGSPFTGNIGNTNIPNRFTNKTNLKGMMEVETKHTGGGGYKVGDRLRLVGGTPVATPYSSVETICIDISGANYTSEANIRVFIGDGSTPGSGASVSSVQFDSNNGLAQINLASGGTGYDPANPPRVRIIDLGEDFASIQPTYAEASVILSKNTGIDRVAKFRVKSVNSTGAITELFVIDRGVYKVFPSDLTTGVPLEYDVEIDYAENNTGSKLGAIDPITGQPLPRAWTQGRGEGSGVRLYLTSREIPDCSERGNAKSFMKLPELNSDVNIVSSLADALNAGLVAAGYDPTDASWGVAPVNDIISALTFNSPVFDGIEIGEETPGFLDKLGLPVGDYNGDITEPVAVPATPENDDNAVSTEVIAIYGVDDFYSGGDKSILGNADVQYINDLFQYELRTVDNGPITSPVGSKNVQVLVLESLRYSNTDVIASANVAFPSSNIPNTVDGFANIWIDSYTGNTSTMTDFVTGGWAYLENGVPKRWQTAMVDPTYIKNTIIYDSTTGEKDHDYSMWDPFKGVLPAVIDAEINYISSNDPVVYNSSRGVFGKNNVGQVWWDTSTVRYNWYEQGTNRERWLNWGSTFPGSAITVYEWVESTVPPSQYTGTGTPKNASEFIIERRLNPNADNYLMYYYFWVQNVAEVSNTAAYLQKRKFSALQLARYLADPIGQGLNIIGFISAGSDSSNNLASFILSNLNNTIREDEQNIQINLSRNLNPIGIKHTSWKLLREGDKVSDIPDDLIDKMIDSLCEEDAEGNTIPASNLSNVERYGVKFRPRQTMFVNPAEARRVLYYTANELLADLTLSTLYTTWYSELSNKTYINVVNWYNTIRVDRVTNEKIRYDSSYKPVFTVASIKELDTLKQSKLADGTVIMVRSKLSENYQLWKWVAKTSSFELITIENETVQLSSRVYTDTVNSTLKQELRSFLTTLRDNIFVGTENMNLIFFALMKYALGEQRQLDWAFKTTYLYVKKEEEDLVQRIGYKPDNFQPVIDYLNEVKPFHSKIREYRDGKRAPLEYIKDQMVSDYDLPPYADPVEGEVRILSFANVDDQEILRTDGAYVKAYSGYSEDQLEWDTANTPVRVNTTTLTFDRVDWRLLEADFDAANSNYVVSIATNMADINAANTYTVSNTSLNAYSMSARIFKFDPEVRSQFDADIDAYRYEGNNQVIVTDTTNVSQLATALQDGALNATLYLVKQKVGGTWQGDELDANVFSKVVYGTDALTLQSVYGYDTAPWDAVSGIGSEWDTYIEVENYEGLFAGNTTFREAGVTYDGFDGFTFNHLLYGEERPEELVYLSPLENFVMHVRTDPYAFDANNDIVSALSVGPYVVDNVSISDSNNIVTITSILATAFLNNGFEVTLSDQSNTILSNTFVISNVNTVSSTFTIPLAGVDSNVITAAGTVTLTSGGASCAAAVEYIGHNDLFGGVEYLRIKTDGSTQTELAQELNYWDDTIHVVDVSTLPIPRPGIPGVIWINSTERVEYRRIVGNTLKDITRGTRGTTIPNGPTYAYDIVSGKNIQTTSYYKHPAGSVVNSAERSEVFNSEESGTGYQYRDPDQNPVWINSNMLSLADCSNGHLTVNDVIAQFLHNNSVAPVGWDSLPWDISRWDAV